MLEVLAEIKLNKENEGGMDRDGFSGMMPSFNVNGELIMCKLIYGDINTKILRGQTYNIIIQLPYGERYKDVINAGYLFNLNIGGRIIGKGKIINVKSVTMR